RPRMNHRNSGLEHECQFVHSLTSMPEVRRPRILPLSSEPSSCRSPPKNPRIHPEGWIPLPEWEAHPPCQSTAPLGPWHDKAFWFRESLHDTPWSPRV